MLQCTYTALEQSENCVKACQIHMVEVQLEPQTIASSQLTQNKVDNASIYLLVYKETMGNKYTLHYSRGLRLCLVGIIVAVNVIAPVEWTSSFHLFQMLLVLILEIQAGLFHLSGCLTKLLNELFQRQKLFFRGIQSLHLHEMNF